MELSKTMKKILFFWSVFHILGYLTFITGLTPSIKYDEETPEQYEYFLFTPKYGTPEYIEEDYEEKIFPTCSSCNYGEKENFWPFHKFTFSVYGGGETQSGFVGIWGYYGHYEFLFYFVLPYLVLCLMWLYKKLI